MFFETYDICPFTTITKPLQSLLLIGYICNIHWNICWPVELSPILTHNIFSWCKIYMNPNARKKDIKHLLRCSCKDAAKNKQSTAVRCKKTFYSLPP